MFLQLYRSADFLFVRASDKCRREKRKTVTGDDLLWSMTTVGFKDYIEPLRVYLYRYREVFNALLSFSNVILFSLISIYI